MKILVTGATGTVGGQVATLLASSGHSIVALVRDPTRAQLPAVVEKVNGDNNVVTRRHRAGELALTEAGVPSVFLRAAGFDYNILMWSKDATRGLIRAPYLDVKLPVVHPGDIAAAAAAALQTDPPITGAFSITGPAKLSVCDQARILSGVLGRELQVVQISEEQAAHDSFPEGTPAFVTSSVLGTMSSAAAAIDVSDDVRVLTGRPARSFAEWAREHVEVFS